MTTLPSPGPSIQHAMQIASDAHDGQVDAGGRPYFDHIYGVLKNTRILLARASTMRPVSARLIYDAEIIAVFHDLLEDTKMTADDLRGQGYPASVISGVIRLTGRPETVTYIDNIRNLAAEGVLATIVVKCADNEHNAQPERIAQLTPDRQSIAQRYRRSLRILVPAYEALTGVEYPLPLGRSLKEAHAPV